MTRATKKTVSKISEPSIDIEIITPDLAQQYLLTNTHNRNVRWHTVDTYARDMTNGNWQYNGDPLRFATDGTLLDGQHRLHAIVQSGETIKMVVMRGLFAHQQHTLDTGIKRSFGDVLRLRGEKNVNALAAIIRGVALWEQTGSLRSTTISNTALLDTLLKYPQLRDPITVLSYAAKELKLPFVALGCCWWRFGQVNATDCDAFFERLTSAQDHHDGEPVYALRRALLSIPRSTNRSTTLRPMHASALLIKAFNKYRAGEEASVMVWRGGGAHPEKYPTLEGAPEGI